MFENLSKLTKEQKIAINALMEVGGVLCVNWIEFNKDRSVTIQVENVYYGMPGNYRITREGKTKKLRAH